MLYMRFNRGIDSFFIFNDKELDNMKKKNVGKIRCFQC